ncbi:MAG: SMI1/KNR4 family protein [Planctomycetia bacterium]|nr:SMI1/KNR4 family protein [Planctomycetia bacterium]
MPIYAQLRDFWTAGGFGINPGTDASSIARFEQKRAVRLPQAFKEYLQTVNGMSDGLTDEELLSFHSLECIDREWESYPRRAPQFVEIVFADYLINSHLYVLRTDESASDLGVWTTADPENYKTLAPCFDDFILAYLSNPAKIAYCW